VKKKDSVFAQNQALCAYGSVKALGLAKRKFIFVGMLEKIFLILDMIFL
jgi:hypothetical protein